MDSGEPPKISLLELKEIDIKSYENVLVFLKKIQHLKFNNSSVKVQQSWYGKGYDVHVIFNAV